MFAEASKIPLSVSKIETYKNMMFFDILTNLPGDYIDHKKKFKVVFPISGKPLVEVHEGPKVITHEIESDGKKDTQSIFLNFVEITELFDDPVIQKLADNFNKVQNVNQIKQLIKNTFY